MTHYTSNYGSQTPKLLIQAINLGFNLFLLQKERVNEVSDCMVMIWVVFVMGKSVYQEPQSSVPRIITTTQYRGVKGLILSEFL